MRSSSLLCDLRQVFCPLWAQSTCHQSKGMHKNFSSKQSQGRGLSKSLEVTSGAVPLVFCPPLSPSQSQVPDPLVCVCVCVCVCAHACVMESPLGISQEWPTPNTGRGGGSWFLEVATRWKSPERHYTAVGPAASLEGPIDTSKVTGPVSELGWW